MRTLSWDVALGHLCICANLSDFAQTSRFFVHFANLVSIFVLFVSIFVLFASRNVQYVSISCPNLCILCPKMSICVRGVKRIIITSFASQMTISNHTKVCEWVKLSVSELNALN